MRTEQFTLSDLFDLLVQQLGLPDRQRTDRPDLCFDDLGLDSFDFARLQAELAERHGVELPDQRDREATLGQIVAAVQGQLDRPSPGAARPQARPLRAA